MATIDGKIKPEVEKLWQAYYGGCFADSFSSLLDSYVRRDDHVLEIGAGSGEGSQSRFEIKGRVARYVGIDPDPRVLTNPQLDEAVVGNVEDLPFVDASFDLIFHTMVAEHLPYPLMACQEMARVLKPRGYMLFETPNRFYYPMLIAKITPQWFHAFYVKTFGSGRVSEDVFPTYYKLNDRKTIIDTLQRAGMAATVESKSMPPGYLRFNKYAFLLGVLYERTAERVFPGLRARLVVVATRAA